MARDVVFRVGTVLAVASIHIGSVALADEDDRKLVDRRPPVRAGAYWAALGGVPADPEGPFESQGVTLLTWLPLNVWPGSQTNASDCWGYVSASGREYAIIGLSKGFGVAEVTDPGNAQIIGYIPGATSTWHDVKVVGDYAYGVSEGGLGIQVINLSQADQGIVTLVANVQQGGHSTTHNIAANTASGFLYLCGANVGAGGLVAVSTANPTAPAIVGAWTNNYVHDAQVVTYTSGPYAGKEIAFCANGGAGLEVLDVTNKAAIVKIGGSTYPQLSYGHQCWLSTDRQYLYLDDELDEQNFGINTNTRVFNVSDPANPVLLGTFTSGTPAIDHNLYVRGNLIFEANYRSGLRVFDASASPTSPTQIAWFDTYPGSNSASFNGAWSCYPLFPSTTVLVSDIERGLFVVRVGALSFTFPSGIPATLQPNTATDIVVSVTEQLVTLDPGSVRLHYRVNGGSFVEAAMSAQGPGQFGATLPAAACLSVVDFYVSAMTDEPQPQVFTSPGGAPSEFHTASVQTGVATVAEDQFETATAWTVVNDPSLTAGGWVRADPNGSSNGGAPANPEDDHTPAPGVQCFFTGQGPVGGGAGTADVDGGPTRLTSPVYDLSAQPHARISYHRWFYTSTGEDALTAEISNNDGATWTLVETVAGGSGGWLRHEFRVADFVAPSAQVRMRFSTADQPNNSVVEAGVDDLTISAPTCGSCYADCNGSGSLTIADFGCFQTRFAAGDPYADCNGAGGLTIADFACFQSAFVAGCP